jgi:hypothetical protein
MARWDYNNAFWCAFFHFPFEKEKTGLRCMRRW